MGITGLLPFIEKASRRTNISEFSGCTVAIDSYCWLHKGAFACAEKLVRGEDTDVHIKYCLKYVTMLLSKNVKPILVFDGRHLPAKAMTENKRRESRNISKKRAAELLKLGKIEEARSYMRRSIDITHEMALSLIQECRKRNVDCIVAPYEADSQLAYLNIKNIAQVVITEDSDLILFGCTKVLFKMDLEGEGTLVETAKLPLIMKCPIEHYTFDKFRQMCIMSGCDYLASLPGIGLAKARQFVTATQDPNFANALRKLPGFFNRSNLTVTDEYRENFLKAEATFKHQFVYDPLERQMVRLTEPEDEDTEQALCVNAGELLDPEVAFQLALGNLDPFTLKKMDVWHPDRRPLQDVNIKTSDWKERGVSNHPSIWSADFRPHLEEPCPWKRKPKVTEPIIALHGRPKRRVMTLASKVVPETEDQNESLSIETLSKMYCLEPSTKRQKCDESQANHKRFDNEVLKEIKKDKSPSPILQNKDRSFKKSMKNGSYSILKRLSRFPRTIIDSNVVESKFFSTSNEAESVIEDSPEKSNTNQSTTKSSNTSIVIEESPEKLNPFKWSIGSDDTHCELDSSVKNSDLDSSQKENSPCHSPMKAVSPVLEPSPRSRNPFVRRLDQSFTEDIVIENTYPMETLVTPTDSQESFGRSPHKPVFWGSQHSSQPKTNQLIKTGLKRNCRVPGLKRTTSLPTNQPTLLDKFGFQKKPALKR